MVRRRAGTIIGKVHVERAAHRLDPVGRPHEPEGRTHHLGGGTGGPGHGGIRLAESHQARGVDDRAGGKLPGVRGTRTTRCSAGRGDV